MGNEFSLLVARLSIMNRRDFLLLRTEPRGLETMPRVVQLSCEQLYMRCLDTQVTGEPRDESADSGAPSAAPALGCGSAETALWGGEPPARFAERTPQHLFEQLDRELREVEVLRVVDSQWLVGDLRREFEHLMASFRARGGRVEIDSRSNSEALPETAESHAPSPLKRGRGLG